MDLNYLINKSIPINFSENTSKDAFGRLKVSSPQTLFDNKFIFSKNNLFWDEVLGAGVTSVYSQPRASVTLTVPHNSAVSGIRQTKRRFNYQPGKGQSVILTGILGMASSGVTKRLGYFDTNNGLFFQTSNGVLSVGKRSYVSGVAVDTIVSQENWNKDKLDGTGKSGLTIDISKIQIFVIDFEWLAAGTVHFGVRINAETIYCHEMTFANFISSVYMSTPNLPIRYEIINDGTGDESSLEQICTTVISEGGVEDTGFLRSHSTSNNHIDCNTADTIYSILGIRLKETYLGLTVLLNSISIVSETNDAFRILLLLNPTITGNLTYADLDESGLQIAVANNSNPSTTVVTNVGYKLFEAYASVDSQEFSHDLQSLLTLGSKIDGTRDEIVLAVAPISNGADIQGAITWKELL